MTDSMQTKVIPQSFYTRSALEVAPELIGCTLHARTPDGRFVSGVIVETEAYLQDDPASHAFRGCSPRNEMMFRPAGYSYVYLIYGMHHCLNVVTGSDGVGEAVLIRALDFGESEPAKRSGAGPGKLCRFLYLTRRHNGIPFFEPQSQLRITHCCADAPKLVQTTRIGISKAQNVPWRWYWKDHPCISKR